MSIYESNGDILNENGISFADPDPPVGGWTDSDNSPGVSTDNENFSGAVCFKFDSGAGVPDPGDSAYRVLNGDFSTPVNCVAELRIYHSDLGTRANADFFRLTVTRADVRLNMAFASDGLFIHNGAGWQLINSGWVQTGIWQRWVFDIDFSIPASANVDIYLDDVFKSNEDCSQTSSYTDGQITFAQYGFNTASRLSYVDYLKIGTGFYIPTTSVSGTRDAIVEGKPYDALSSILQGVSTDDVGAVMRSVIASYRGSIVQGYIHDRVPAILQGVISNSINVVTLGVTTSFRGAVVLAMKGAISDISSIIVGNVFSNLNSIIQSVSFNYKYAVVRGKSYYNVEALIVGTYIANEANENIDAVLRGKYYIDRYATVKGKSHNDIRALILSVVCNEVEAAISGNVWSNRFAVERGILYTDQSSVIEGHLIKTDLTFKYNINRASFDYYYALTNMSTTYKTAANNSFYEEDSSPIYIYYGYGREAYEYYPSTETLVPAYSNVPSDAEWEIKVYANTIDNRSERNAVIKKLSEVDFDAEIKAAFSKVVDQSYHTFSINLGIAGITDSVYAIMRVKATSNRVSWILGKDFPLYIIGTDFGVYSLLTTTRRIKIVEARLAIIRGLVYPFSLVYGILQGVTFNKLVEGIVEGRKFSEIRSLIGGIMSPKIDEFGIIRGCINCAVDIYSYGYGVEEGKNDFVIWLGTKSSTDKSLVRYEEDYTGLWTSRIMLGTSNEGYYFNSTTDWTINNIAALRDVLILGVITDSVSVLITGS